MNQRQSEITRLEYLFNKIASASEDEPPVLTEAEESELDTLRDKYGSCWSNKPDCQFIKLLLRIGIVVTGLLIPIMCLIANHSK